MQSKAILPIALVALLAGCESAESPQNQANEEAKTAEVMPAESAGDAATKPYDENDEMAKIAYAMGANSGAFLARSLPEFEKWGMAIDGELIRKGFLDSLDGKVAMNEQEIQQVLLAFQSQIREKLAQIEAEQATVSAEANDAFLAEYSQKEGVQKTESGIYYLMLEEGTGAKPTAEDTVKVHYVGRLVTGDEFDSSYARNQPMEFALNRVIAGWTEGVQLVAEGGKIELVLPPELAYGDRGTPNIPPNSVLVFEVELLEIVKAEEPAVTEEQ